jgi:nitrate/TMAO reductase-like tetraheme cytochrome c subunit
MRYIFSLAIVLLFSFTTLAQPASQMFHTSDRCMACHNGLIDTSGKDISIGVNWRSSMMAHSARDPYWQAGVRREITDHPGAWVAIEDKCSSCHMPMARFTAKTAGKKGTVFEHLPVVLAFDEDDVLAANGVSCTMCHQITEEKLGTEESFTAGFVVDTQKPLGQRAVYGPFDIDDGRTRVMKSSAQFVPTMKTHIRDSAFCATCHTLYTHALGSDGQVVGELPEQVPYLEWKHSAYKESRNCQSCHMPVLMQPSAISSVLGLPRDGFSQHVFRGGNFFMPKIFNLNRIELGVEALPSDLNRTVNETLENLQTKTARVEFQQASVIDGRLKIDVSVRNFAGHKLPTAYPSRRVWLNLTVRNQDGQIIFTSGELKQDGSIEGNDNDADPERYEPHYNVIENQQQVQIYESIMVNHQAQVTTSLLSGVRYIKDNRILPRGFDKTTAHEDISIRGAAAEDSNFNDKGDFVSYSIGIDNSRGPFLVKVMLWYQPIAYRWAKNLASYDAMETKRFVGYYDQTAQESAVILAQDQTLVK